MLLVKIMASLLVCKKISKLYLYTKTYLATLWREALKVFYNPLFASVGRTWAWQSQWQVYVQNKLRATRLKEKPSDRSKMESQDALVDQARENHKPHEQFYVDIKLSGAHAHHPNMLQTHILWIKKRQGVPKNTLPKKKVERCDRLKSEPYE